MRLAYFLFTTYVWMLRLVEQVLRQGQHRWQHLRSYPVSQQWLFLEGHTLPLPRSHVHPSQKGTWYYENHRLTQDGRGPLYRMGWLSAKVVTENAEYEIDTFLELFRAQGIPPLSHLFLAWCAETHRWFPPGSVVLHVIDEEGEPCIYRLDQPLHAIGHRLYVLTSNVLFVDPYTHYHA